MATGIAPQDKGPTPPPSQAKGRGGVAAGGKFVEFDQYIDNQLRRTRGQVKTTEIAIGLLTLGAAASVFFLIVAVADHWIIRHGFNSWERFVLFGALIAGCGYIFVWTVLPAILSRVNPIYAAQAIERSKPSLKNSLINFLLFRKQPETIHSVVYRAMEEQAATGLAHVPIETAVDRTRLIHLGYVLIGCVTMLALYLVFSPKNPLVSAYRVLVPWSDVAAPSRVSIIDIKPRDTSAFGGQPVPVSAEIDGLSSGEKALLLYTSADGQVVDRAIEMFATDGNRQTVQLPETKDGVQQDLTYRIEAGDSQSSTFHVKVIDAPTIVVDSVQYKYPDYTAIQPNPNTVAHRGDLKAVEGTQVTIRATANQPIKTAAVDFNCDGKPDMSMKVSGQSATATFILSLNNDRTAPLFNSYQLRMVNDRRLENPQPIRHQVEVVPDLPPEVAFLAPEREEISVPLDGQVSLEVRAIDPDFALAAVKLRAKTDHGVVFDQALLPDAPHTGSFVGKYQFMPSKLGLKPGDVVHYSAVAVDNKTPQANETATPDRRIRITGAENVNPQQQPNDAGHSDKANNQSQPSSERSNENRPQQNNQQNQNTGDKNQQPPDQKQQQGNNRQNNQQNNNQQPSDNKPQSAADNAEQNKDQAQENKDQKAGENSQQPKNENGRNSEQQPGKSVQQSKSDQQSDKGNQQENKSDQQQSKSDDHKQKGDSKQGGQEGGASSKSDGGKSSQQQGGKSSQQGGGKGSSQKAEKNSQSGSEKNSSPQKSGSDSQSAGSQQSAGDQNQSKQNQSAQSDQDNSGQNNNGQSGAGQQNSGQNKSEPMANNSGKSDNQGQTADQGQSANDRPQPDHSPAPSDGHDDGKGIERILDHPPQQQPKEGNPSSGNPASGSENQHGQKSSGQQNGNAEQSGQQAPEKADQPGQGQPSDKNAQSQNGNMPDKKAWNDDDKQSGKASNKENQLPGKERTPGDQPKDGRQPPAESDADKGQPQSSPGAGAQTNSGSMPDKQSPDKKQAGNQPGEKPQGGDPNFPKGDAGSGHSDNNPKGSAGARKAAKPVEKHPDDDSNQPPDQKQESSTSSRDTHESDTKNKDGGQGANPNMKPSPQPAQNTNTPGGGGSMGNAAADGSGEKSGGGGKGGGQKADKPGTGVAGEHTASDQGRGAAAEPGKGETSNNAGNDQKSDHPTGQASNEQGNGSSSAASSKSKQDNQQSPGDQGQGNKDQGHASSGPRTTGNGQPKSGGTQGNGQNPGNEVPDAPGNELQSGEAPPVDDPNLAYAKKATALAIDRLKSALKHDKPGDHLLEDLGWSKDEAQQFVQRQEERLQNAERSNPNDKQRHEAEDALRSLGLRPDRSTQKRGGITSDQVRGMSSDRKTAPPPDYADQFKAYTQGLNSAGTGSK